MAWITLTEADLLLVISGAELEEYRTRALQAKQEDPVQLSMDLVVETVRGAIIGNPRNQVGADGTIPDGLKLSALDLIVWRIMLRCGRVNDPNGARKEAADKATELLGLVAQGKRTIEAPVTETTVTRSSPRGAYGSDEKLAI